MRTTAGPGPERSESFFTIRPNVEARSGGGQEESGKTRLPVVGSTT
jgi:hypothetical protein